MNEQYYKVRYLTHENEKIVIVEKGYWTEYGIPKRIQALVIRLIHLQKKDDRYSKPIWERLEEKWTKLLEKLIPKALIQLGIPKEEVEDGDLLLSIRLDFPDGEKEYIGKTCWRVRNPLYTEGMFL